jgi:hypothetical protein
LQESSDDREEIIETDGDYQELILAVKEYNTNRACSQGGKIHFMPFPYGTPGVEVDGNYLQKASHISDYFFDHLSKLQKNSGLE